MVRGGGGSEGEFRIIIHGKTTIFDAAAELLLGLDVCFTVGSPHDLIPCPLSPQSKELL